MIEMKLSVLALISFSLVNELWAQYDDACSFQGQQVTGDFTMPGFCLLYRCIPGQGVTTIGCGIRVPPEGCFIDHPAIDNYPECCYTNVVCPGTNQTQAGYEENEVQANPVQQKVSTTLTDHLLPPTQSGITSRYDPQSAQPGNVPPDNASANLQNVYNPPDNKTSGSGPYYYRK